MEMMRMRTRYVFDDRGNRENDDSLFVLNK